ncbi:MAG TPA: NAD(P)/FAD-dependent oxidoreductase, partial [Solirubrobacterales bacterium]
MSDAIVVGTGPNGLSAAATLAAQGVDVTAIEAAPTIGGGTRSSELTLPGLLHDDCSAAHPFSPGSQALNSLGLERHGLEWAWAEIDLAHPLDDGSAAVMQRSIESTAAGLGPAGPAWRRLFGYPAEHFEAFSEDAMRPLLRLPRHPLTMARFAPAVLPVSLLVRRLPTPQARALFGGTAAHSFSPFSHPLSSAVGMALTCACHRNGWPVARGGSRAIADALAAVVREHGGRIETGRPVRSLDELPAADAVILDLAPSAVVDIAGKRLPSRVARAYRRYRHGPGAFKVDLAVEGGVPWADSASGRAGTVHAIGSFEEVAV